MTISDAVETFIDAMTTDPAGRWIRDLPVETRHRMMRHFAVICPHGLDAYRGVCGHCNEARRARAK